MVLQSVRERMGLTDPVARALGLDHVLQSTAATGGSNPYTQSNPFAVTRPFHDSQPYVVGSSSAQIESFGASTFNPVTWLGPRPSRRPDDPTDRRPVVAILDTGCGQHEWLDYVVQKGASLDGRPIGYQDMDPELSGDLAGPLDADLDSYAGHGTFVTGLVHVTCPDADIVSYRVLDSDGSVVESDFLGVLVDILEAHRRAIQGEPGGQIVDVILLTCGYYHETPFEELGATGLARILGEFGRLGVAVVAAAGNDSTTRPMFPAGLDIHDEPDAVPVVGVGALNPDRKSVALFSNAAPWVTAYRPGVACVSTMPRLWGSRAPSAHTSSYGRVRSSVDPDDFGGGFATGSGTSFAAAVFAGELAHRLSPVSSEDVHALVADRRRAVEYMTES
jgi:subtilisin family serine protease